MSDVHVVRYLLAHNTALTAEVPATRIVGGPLPQGTALPAIAVTHVSTMRMNMVAETSTQLATARTQVTVFAANYPNLKDILALVRDALPRSRGTVDGVHVDSIVSDIEGPDFRDDAEGIYMQSHDFTVVFIE